MPLLQLLDTDRFMPHGMCYLWEPDLLWTHVLSDVLIGVAYFAISLSLAWLVWRSARERVDESGPFRRLPFWWMFLAFGLFIVACGATHLMAAWNVWNVDYWLSGGVKVVTAVASVATAVAFPPLVPRALALVREARASEIRKRELEEANERISELDRLKTEFFANVSHELRTPLALISGRVERILEQDGVDDQRRRELETVLRNARTLDRHVDDLLNVTRIESGGMSPDYRRGDLADLVRDAAAHFEGLATDRGVRFDVDLEAPVPAVIDPEKVERVVLNLLSNAFKFVPDGGTVRVALEAEGEGTGGGDEQPSRARMVVADSGPGVPEHLRESIFERFRQVEDGAGRAFGGTGLGLSIVRDFVDLHGGEVRVEDAREGGAAFVVVLPLAPDPSVATAPPPAEGAEGFSSDRERGESVVAAVRVETPSRARELGRQEPAGGSPPEADETRDRAPVVEGRPTVLVAEDNADMRRFLEDVLSDEVDPIVAEDADEAIRRAEEVRPDLVLSDVMMPGKSGQQLLDELRGREELRQIPFLALTARDDESLRVSMLERGAQDYITKPFNPAELRARIRNWLSVARTRALLQQELAVTEEDLEALAREVRRRREQLEAALEEARAAGEAEMRANRAKSDFLAVMSHELRTPLTAIMGYTGLLREEIPGPLTEEQHEQIRRIGRNSEHLLELIDRILEYVRLDRDESSAADEPVAIRAVVEDVEAGARSMAEEKGLALEMELDEGVPDPVTDGGRLRQILLNLVLNGVKYTHEGEVRLTVSSGEGTVRFRVEDTGIGIAPEHRDQVFEPFWQVDQSSTRDSGGVGLGLSISRRLARRLGGELTLRPREGGGSVFTLEIPIERDGGGGAGPSGEEDGG